jgi:hypothetical protein
VRVPVLLLASAAVLLCACSHVKETKGTAVENPAPSKGVVVERPVASAARSCTLGSASYSDASLSCQNHYKFRCHDGVWEGLNDPC